jgi:DNA-binding beta-propeller fold protein YncE
MMRILIRGVTVLALMGALAAGMLDAQANARWYIATYSNHLLVWDEASEQVVDRIEVSNFIPTGIVVNENRDRLYVMEARVEKIEVVDLDKNQVVDEFTLSEGNVTVRIGSFAPHPSDDRAVMFVKRYTKHSDRYEVEGPFILEYDLTTKSVSDTIPWPDDEERDRGISFRYSPDGETLYVFTDDIIALDAETFEEVDRWEISQALEPGLGRPSFGPIPGTYDEDGVATSLYRMTDPAQNRRMMGVARVRLSEKEVDFYTLGTSEPIGRFVVAPGGEKAYGLYDEIGRYEFWEFDLVNRSVSRRVPFPGRPRMGLQISADGTKLYIHVAGNTIDIYDSGTFEFLRTVTFDEDMTGVAVIPQGGNTR